MANGNEIVLSVTAAAIALSSGLDRDEIALMSAVFTQLGDTLATLAAAEDYKKPPPEGEV
jgi:hypothetical protein